MYRNQYLKLKIKVIFVYLFVLVWMTWEVYGNGGISYFDVLACSLKVICGRVVVVLLIVVLTLTCYNLRTG